MNWTLDYSPFMRLDNKSALFFNILKHGVQNNHTTKIKDEEKGKTIATCRKIKSIDYPITRKYNWVTSLEVE
jgi:hypothetical protein